MRNCIFVVILIAITGCSTIQTNNSQRGWLVESDTVEMFVTENGGHMAPVYFCNDTDKPVQPYYISPWQNNQLKDLDPVMVPLRGDFFCMPFGINSAAYKGEKHPVHGEVAAAKWTLLQRCKVGDVTSLKIELETKIRKGKVTKTLSVVDGHNVIYTTHKMEGYHGAMPLAHHCILRVPEEEDSLKITVSKFDLGMTAPDLFSDPKNGEYQALAINARFTDISKVPVMQRDAPDADCSSFPRRQGYCDLIQIFKKPSPTPAWTTVVCEKDRYLWYSLKDAAVLPGTVFWISNKGRYGYPWNGRNRCLGIEDSCSYFAAGLGPSVEPNKISKAGFPTAIKFNSDKPTIVNYIQGAVQVPAGFEKVRDVKFTPGKVTFISITGKEVTTVVNHQFLKTGRL